MTTLSTTVGRPQPGEYAPCYEKYISQIQGEDILGVLDEQHGQTRLLFSRCSEADGDLRYAPEKWSVKEVIGHVSDAERVFGYRALRIARCDATPLSGFDENDYVKHGPFTRRPLPDLIEDFVAVRQATLSLFRNCDPEGWTRRGVANQNAVSVRSLAYIIAGHELHHRRILQEKYLKILIPDSGC